MILSTQAHWFISWPGEREQQEEEEEEEEGDDAFHFDDFSENEAELCSAQKR